MTAAPYEVRLTPTDEDDLVRLANFMLDRAKGPRRAERGRGSSIATLRQTIDRQLSAVPWSFRKAGAGSRATRRELVAPSGASGCVGLNEIESASRVQVLAVRRRLEHDCR